MIVYVSVIAGDSRSYSYVLGLSTEDTPDWNDLLFLARLIPRILHNVNRVCYIFGGPVQYPISDITDTKINKYSLAQLRQADHLANTVRIKCHSRVKIVLNEAKKIKNILLFPFDV